MKFIKNKKARGEKLLALLIGIPAFWIIIKYLTIGGLVGTTLVFANPLIIFAIILFVIYLFRKK